MVRRYWSGGVVWLFIYSEMYIIRKKGVRFKLIFLKKWLPWVVKHLPFQQDKEYIDDFVTQHDLKSKSEELTCFSNLNNANHIEFDKQNRQNF